MARNTRKVQLEVENLLKKVKEEMSEFDELFQKCLEAEQGPRRDKIQSELKRDLGKLQRRNHEIKHLIQSGEIRDTQELNEATSKIQTAMGEFWDLERGTKTKAFSNRALASTQKHRTITDQATEEVENWLVASLETLRIQRETAEFNIESQRSALASANAAKAGKGKSGKAAAANTQQLEAATEEINAMKDCLITRSLYHSTKLEQILRLLRNQDIEPYAVTVVKDDLDEIITAIQAGDDLNSGWREADEMSYESFDLPEISIGANIGDHLQPRGDSAADLTDEAGGFSAERTSSGGNFAAARKEASESKTTSGGKMSRAATNPGSEDSLSSPMHSDIVSQTSQQPTTPLTPVTSPTKSKKGTVSAPKTAEPNAVPAAATVSLPPAAPSQNSAQKSTSPSTNGAVPAQRHTPPAAPTSAWGSKPNIPAGDTHQQAPDQPSLESLLSTGPPQAHLSSRPGAGKTVWGRPVDIQQSSLAAAAERIANAPSLDSLVGTSVAATPAAAVVHHHTAAAPPQANSNKKGVSPQPPSAVGTSPLGSPPSFTQAVKQVAAQPSSQAKPATTPRKDDVVVPNGAAQVSAKTQPPAAAPQSQKHQDTTQSPPLHHHADPIHLVGKLAKDSPQQHAAAGASKSSAASNMLPPAAEPQLVFSTDIFGVAQSASLSSAAPGAGVVAASAKTPLPIMDEILQGAQQGHSTPWNASTPQKTPPFSASKVRPGSTPPVEEEGLHDAGWFSCIRELNTTDSDKPFTQGRGAAHIDHSDLWGSLGGTTNAGMWGIPTAATLSAALSSTPTAQSTTSISPFGAAASTSPLTSHIFWDLCSFRPSAGTIVASLFLSITERLKAAGFFYKAATSDNCGFVDNKQDSEDPALGEALKAMMIKQKIVPSRLRLKTIADEVKATLKDVLALPPHTASSHRFVIITNSPAYPELFILLAQKQVPFCVVHCSPVASSNAAVFDFWTSRSGSLLNLSHLVAEGQVDIPGDSDIIDPIEESEWDVDIRAPVSAVGNSVSPSSQNYSASLDGKLAGPSGRRVVNSQASTQETESALGGNFFANLPVPEFSNLNADAKEWRAGAGGAATFPVVGGAGPSARRGAPAGFRDDLVGSLPTGTRNGLPVPSYNAQPYANYPGFIRGGGGMNGAAWSTAPPLTTMPGGSPIQQLRPGQPTFIGNSAARIVPQAHIPSHMRR